MTMKHAAKWICSYEKCHVLVEIYSIMFHHMVKIATYITYSMSQELLEEAYHMKIEENRRAAEERTAKKRAKRLKKKMQKKQKKEDTVDHKNNPSSDSESEGSNSGT